LVNTVENSRKNSIAEVEEALRIVVVYEDTVAHVRALHIHDYLITHLGNEMPLLFSWWSFELLQETSHAEAAARAMSSADLVIFSAHSGDEWPPAVNSWVASWTRGRTARPGAVAAIFSPAAPGHGHICGRHAALHAVAQNSGMDFLAEEVDRLPSPNFAQADMFIQRVAPTRPMFQDVSGPADSSPFWGING
jgi:hypothetical protein